MKAVAARITIHPCRDDPGGPGNPGGPGGPGGQGGNDPNDGNGGNNGGRWAIGGETIGTEETVKTTGVESGPGPEKPANGAPL